MAVFAPFPVTYTPEPTRPSGGVQPGAVALMGWTLAHWDAADGHNDANPSNLGIYNPRDICGNPWPGWRCTGSQHARGAAGDVGYPDVGPAGHPEGWKYAHWLVANHAVLGLQETIYAGKRWTNQTLAWRTYSGRDNHQGHVHWALNSAGARNLTAARIQSVAPHPATPPPATHPDDEDEPMFYIWFKDTRVKTPTVTPVPGVHLHSVAGNQAVHITQDAYNAAAYLNGLAHKPPLEVIGSATKPARTTELRAADGTVKDPAAFWEGVHVLNGPLRGIRP